MISEARYAREALLLHYFFGVEQLALRGTHRLGRLWDACAQAGMDRTPSLGGNLSLPTDLDASLGGRSLCQRTDATATRQATLYSLNGVVGLTIMLAADEGPGRTGAQSAARLRALAQDWDEAYARAAATAGHGTDDDRTVIGSVRVHRSLTLPGGPTPVDPAAVGEELRRELAPQTQLSRPVNLTGQLVLWEFTQRGDPFSADRELLATGPATDEQEGLLDDWTWTTVDDSLVPLTRYLANATIVRNQYRVRLAHAASIASHLRRLRCQGEELTREWREVLVGHPASTRIGRRDLARCESIAVRARRLLAEERLANAATGDIRLMQRNLEIAADGMKVLGTGTDGTPKTVGRDNECHSNLAQILDDDVTHSEIAREQVAETARIASETATQHLQRHQQYLALIQTAIIGALLMTLTAIQALAYKLPIPAGLHAPLIALLGSLGLGLPLLVVRRWRGGTGGRIGSILEIASLAATGAAAGWLVGRALGHTSLLVLSGVLLLGVAGMWLTRRSSP
ncbi:CATRA conflict system CASPASE/TPR repeat-associated protein [Streptomyces coeruleorubidus]|uniref:CATRA conflict system CASPASE/TPR repeat-associated protein n=1 Tax=Streptomyces coeruleorubidus TaxID=116188 RepID=UPI0033B40134